MSLEARRNAKVWRRQLSDAELLLWSRIRNRQVASAKFRRQHPIGAYILDFYSPECLLAIEVDGGQHFEDEHAIRDRERTAKLGLLGIRVLRFTNLEVLNETDAVLERIYDAVAQHPSP